MGHGASVASTAPHWTATKTTLRLINVKAKKGGHRKDRNSRTPSSTNAADDDEDNCPLPPGLHHAPPFLHHKTTSRIKPRSSKGKPDQDIPCHSLVDMQFRADGYQWIADALEKETKAALRQVRDRVGRDRHVPQVRFFTTNGDGIDLVRCRLVDMPLESFSRCIWGTFTSTMTYDDWSVQVLNGTVISQICGHLQVVLCISASNDWTITRATAVLCLTTALRPTYPSASTFCSDKCEQRTVW
ncbi:hypothetical protein, variant [Aphanomyces astaci]|uniref:Uncharacterized protein n=1 Tax=Aphanomyces astaci TaxID=112090 RepID=W4GCE9_APHAT|nr:hypothetical protein, variant [Aphanomyces astaci]ETV76744.1 hypothetical protein, variant [Aphanomyces astaci]|eukprot:XP_009833655.1 hypothetical protein, variant [Aphanomyces astaci]